MASFEQTIAHLMTAVACFRFEYSRCTRNNVNVAWSGITMATSPSYVEIRFLIKNLPATAESTVISRDNCVSSSLCKTGVRFLSSGNGSINKYPARNDRAASNRGRKEQTRTPKFLSPFSLKAIPFLLLNVEYIYICTQ